MKRKIDMVKIEGEGLRYNKFAGTLTINNLVKGDMYDYLEWKNDSSTERSYWVRGIAWICPFCSPESFQRFLWFGGKADAGLERKESYAARVWIKNGRNYKYKL